MTTLRLFHLAAGTLACALLGADVRAVQDGAPGGASRQADGSVGAGLEEAGQLPVSREIIDGSLRSSVVDLIGWDDRTLTVRDASGEVRQEPRSGVIAVVGATPDPFWPYPGEGGFAGGTPIVVEFTDGRRVFGSVGPWDSASIEAKAVGGRADAGGHDGFDGEDSIGMLDHSLTMRSLAFEDVGRILFDPWARSTAAATDWRPDTDDELVLANGDTLRGFLVSVGESVVFDAGNGDRAYPMARVSEVRLGNESVDHAGPRLWMRSGEIRNGTGLDGHTEHPEADGFVVAGQVASAWFDDRARIPLADAELISAEPAVSRRWARRPVLGSPWASPLGAADVAMDGPMRTVWALPADATAFSAIARLGADLDEPDRAPGPWADAVLTVSVEQGGVTRPIGSYRLDADTPESVIAVNLPDGPRRRLVIELGEGRFGPIQDRLLLRRPFLLGR